MNQFETVVRLTLRLPQDMAVFLDRQAKENCTSRNAEIVRSVKERMKNAENEKAGSPTTA